MYIYCGNDPVNRIDQTGQSWESFWNNLLNTFEDASACFALGVATTQADSPMPGIADALGVAIIVGTVIVSAVIATHQTITTTTLSIPASPNLYAAEAQNSIDSEVLIAPTQSYKHKQAYFPSNPYSFNPRGLRMETYSGTKNGMIIKWFSPNGLLVFEWNEDILHGAHYHVLLPEDNGRHNGYHYAPGSPVPEPFNTIYFGG